MDIDLNKNAPIAGNVQEANEIIKALWRILENLSKKYEKLSVEHKHLKVELTKLKESKNQIARIDLFHHQKISIQKINQMFDVTRYVKRIMSVVATCRLQGKNTLEYLTTSVRAHLLGDVYPSLIPLATNASSALAA